MALMSKARLVLLSLLAVFAVGAMLASSASAAINFEYRVKGTKLAAGSTKEFTVTSDGKNFDLHGSAGGVASLLLSHEISVESGAKIIGGIPGTNEETVIFKGVTIDPPLSTCGVTQSGVANQVKTVLLKTEIVEGSAGNIGNGEVDILFTPKTGTTFATFKLTGSCTLSGAEVPVSGSILGGTAPSKTEVVNGEVNLEAKTKGYKVSPGTGTEKTAGLIFAGGPATLTGLTLVLLTSGEAYGVF